MEGGDVGVTEEQEELAELLVNWRPGEWVAGCLWEQRSSSDITAVLDGPSGATEWTTRTGAGREVSLLLSEEAERPSGSYREIEVPGAFCYVPE